MKLVNPGDSIEGERVVAYGRKILASGLPTRGKNGRLRFHIDIKRTGGGRILKESQPKVTLYSRISRLDEGDELWGGMLEGSCEKKFHPDDIHVGGARSGTHPGQSWTMEGSCFLRITKNWQMQAALPVSPSIPALQA